MISPRKRLFIASYVWMFGSTKKAAAEVYKKHMNVKSTGYIEAVIDCYRSNARKAFHND